METTILDFINRALDTTDDRQYRMYLVKVGMFTLRDYLAEYTEYAPRSGDRQIASELLSSFPLGGAQ